MPEKFKPDQWRFKGHQSCKQLTVLMLEQTARDHSFGRIRQFQKGGYIWKGDDRADRIYVLNRGQVAIVAGDAERREVIIQVIDAGQTFGELCFCAEGQGLRHNAALVVNEAEAAEIELDNFLRYLQDNRDALDLLVFTFCTRLAETESRIEVLSYRGAEDRLARLLIRLAGSRGSPSAMRAGEVALTISHDELSLMAAMTRPHVSVTMGKLRKNSLVRYKRGGQLTLDIAQLTAFVNKGNT